MDIQIQLEDGATPRDHEILTAIFLIKQGKSPKFLAERKIANTKTPDITMDNIEWEMKSPIGSGRENLEHAFKAAVKQSENIIVITKTSELLFFEK